MISQIFRATTILWHLAIEQLLCCKQLLLLLCVLGRITSIAQNKQLSKAVSFGGCLMEHKSYPCPQHLLSNKCTDSHQCHQDHQHYHHCHQGHQESSWSSLVTVTKLMKAILISNCYQFQGRSSVFPSSLGSQGRTHQDRGNAGEAHSKSHQW